MAIKNKLFAGATLLAVLVMPVFASAQTAPSDSTTATLEAQIEALLAEIQELQAQLNAQNGSGGSNSSCYTFSTNFGEGGGSSADVQALQTDLSQDGESVSQTGVFDDQTASAVVSFQEKYASAILTPYGLTNGTGYVGRSTRAELNSLFGCQNGNNGSNGGDNSALTITSPAAGQTFAYNDNMTIAWTPASTGVASIALEPTSGGSATYIYAQKVFGYSTDYSGYFTANLLGVSAGTYNVELFADLGGGSVASQPTATLGPITVQAAPAINGGLSATNLGANTSVTPGMTDVKIGSYGIYNGTSESVSVNSVTIYAGSNGNMFQNLHITTSEGTQIGLTQPAVANNDDYTFDSASSAAPIIPAGGTLEVDVYADISSSVAVSAGSGESDATALAEVQGVGVSTQTTYQITQGVTGQTVSITSGGGSITPIVFTSPAGGESWAAGSTHVVQWTSNGNSSDNDVSISLKDQTNVLYPPLATVPVESNQATITLPSHITAGSNYQMDAQVEGNQSSLEESQSNSFSVTAAGNSTESASIYGVPVGAPGVTAGATQATVGTWEIGTTNPAELASLTLHVVGTDSISNLHNVTVEVNRVLMGNVIPSLTSNTIVLPGSAGMLLMPGQNNMLTITADVAGTPGSNFEFEIVNPSDAVVTDIQSGANLPVTLSGAAGSSISVASVSSNNGTLSFTPDHFAATYTEGSPLPSTLSNSPNLYTNTPFLQSGTITNTSNVPVTLTQSVPNQPSWLNTGYSTSPITLQPGQVLGNGGYLDPTTVANDPGTYTTNIIFSGNFVGSPKSIPLTLTVLPASAANGPTASLSVSPSTITIGQSATLSWSSTNATNCAFTNGASGVSGSSGSMTVTPANPQTGTYTIACSGSGGTSAPASANLTVGALPATGVTTVTVTPSTIQPGQSATVYWSGPSGWTGVSQNSQICSLSGGISGSGFSQGAIVVNPTVAGSVTYNVTCGGSSGSATLTVGSGNQQVPTVSLTANPTSLYLGQPTLLTWSSLHATACTASGVGGNWTGPVSLSGAQSVTPLNDAPLAPYNITYEIICTGPGGTSAPGVAVVNVSAAQQNTSSASVVVSSPVTNFSVAQGGTVPMVWTGGTPTVLVSLWQNGSDLGPIASNVTNTGSYTVQLPSGDSGTGYQISIGTVGTSPGSVGMSGTFSITPTAVGGILSGSVSAGTPQGEFVGMGVAGMQLAQYQFSADANGTETLNAVTVTDNASMGDKSTFINYRLTDANNDVLATGSENSSGQIVFNLSGANVSANSTQDFNLLADTNMYPNAQSGGTHSFALSSYSYSNVAGKAFQTLTSANTGSTFTVYRNTLNVTAGSFNPPATVSAIGTTVGEFNFAAGGDANNNPTVSSITLSTAGSLIQSNTTQVLGLYDASNPSVLLAQATVNGTGNATFSTSGWMLTTDSTKTLLVKTIGAPSNFTAFSSGATGSYQVNLQGVTWNDSVSSINGLSPSIAMPVAGQTITGVTASTVSTSNLATVNANVSLQGMLSQLENLLKGL